MNHPNIPKHNPDANVHSVDELMSISNEKLMEKYEKIDEESKPLQIYVSGPEKVNKHKMYNYYREYPSSYIGYYVETNGIDDIEKFINEKNKNKYKGRIM